MKDCAHLYIANANKDFLDKHLLQSVQQECGSVENAIVGKFSNESHIKVSSYVTLSNEKEGSHCITAWNKKYSSYGNMLCADE
jgi:hypothetical protein